MFYLAYLYNYTTSEYFQIIDPFANIVDKYLYDYVCVEYIGPFKSKKIAESYAKQYQFTVPPDNTLTQKGFELPNDVLTIKTLKKL